MNVQAIVIAACALTAGVAGALTFSNLETAPASSSDAPAVAEKLTAQLDELTRQTQKLNSRIDRLESKVAMAAAMNADAIEADVAAGADDEPIRAAVVASEQDTEPDVIVLKDQVSTALKEIREQEEKERDEERAERRAERFEQQLAELAQELNLTPYQTNSLRDTLTEERTKFDTARDEARDAGDWGAMRDSMTKIREETKTALAGYLYQDQIDKYDEIQTSRFGFFGGGGRRRDRGGSGGSNDSQ